MPICYFGHVTRRYLLSVSLFFLPPSDPLTLPQVGRARDESAFVGNARLNRKRWNRRHRRKRGKRGKGGAADCIQRDPIWFLHNLGCYREVMWYDFLQWAMSSANLEPVRVTKKRSRQTVHGQMMQHFYLRRSRAGIVIVCFLHLVQRVQMSHLGAQDAKSAQSKDV